MFVLELSKPSGICLAAIQQERLVGYLVCSRYDTVWHLMNVAVDARRPRRGHCGTTLLRRLFEHRGQAERAVHARGAGRRTWRPSRLYERFGFRSAGVPARLLPRQP